MATFYILNLTSVGTIKFRPGDLINDAIDPAAAIAAAGGVLWPSADATVATAATLVQSKQKNRAISDDESESIMFAAANRASRESGAAAGTDIADSDNTIQATGGLWRKCPTITANRIITIGTTGAVAGMQMDITRLSTAAFTMAIANGGGGGGTLTTFPASKKGSCTLQFDGTNWALRAVGVDS